MILKKNQTVLLLSFKIDGVFMVIKLGLAQIKLLPIICNVKLFGFIKIILILIQVIEVLIKSI